MMQCICGKRFKKAIDEAKHRHNFPLMCRRVRKRRLTSKPVKDKLLRRAGYKCHYCLAPLTHETMTVDHVIPVSKGGHNGSRNKVACCKSCNVMKGSRDYDVFLYQIGRDLV